MFERHDYLGKFFVFEGIDGSGKATQTKLLVNHLKEQNYAVATIEFPQYNKESSALVKEYLKGTYGSDKEVTPYQGSIFYACDRFDGSFQIMDYLKRGIIVVSDRYMASNIGHQGGKIKDSSERKKFLKWLYGLEYGIFKIPKPDISFLLKTNPVISQELMDKEGKHKDIHEDNITHLKNALNSFLEAVEEFPNDFQLIECCKDRKILSEQEIHQKIWCFVERLL